jgi:solute carrier family 20 (sodium-dependent phosphate transporter)
MVLASILEFVGSIAVGQRVADTIRTKVVNVNMYNSNPAVLMLGMLCAVVASSLYLTWATKIGLPVSTTHSIMGGVIGMGIATVGANNVIWTDFGSGNIAGGVVSVFLAWVIAPALAGAFASIIFLITKYTVMVRKNPVMKGLMLLPLYFGMTAALITMLVVWKGGSINLDKWTEGQIAGVIVGVGLGWAALMSITLVPWLYRLVAKNDWELKWYHIPMGLLLLRRPDPPAQPEGAAGGLRDFYAGHMTLDELKSSREGQHAAEDAERGVLTEAKTDPEAKANPTDSDSGSDRHAPSKASQYHKPIVGPRPEGAWHSGPVMWWFFKYIFLRGVDQDILSQQKRQSMLSGDLAKTHAAVKHFDNRAEYLYSFMQVMTACTASFTHGANDVANAIGPYATIYQIWQSGTIAGSKSNVPLWIL